MNISHQLMVCGMNRLCGSVLTSKGHQTISPCIAVHWHLMPNQQHSFVLSPWLFELLYTMTRDMPFRMNRRGKKTLRHYLGISCFSRSQIRISGFLLSHLQWWPELYSTVNWEEFHNTSTLDLMRCNLGDSQHTWNSSGPYLTLEHWLL